MDSYDASPQASGTGVPITAAVIGLLAGILCFGVAGTTVLGCGTNACSESMLAPGTLFGATLALFTALALLSRRATVPRAISTSLAGFALIAAIGSSLTGLLWSGIWVSEFLGDKTNPWRNSFLDGPSQLLVLVNNYGSHPIPWEGGPLVAFAEISVLTIGFLAAAAALVICARALLGSPGPHPSGGIRRLLLSPPLLVLGTAVGLILATYSLAAIPVIAGEAAGNRAAKYLSDATHQLASTYGVALSTYNASQKSVTDLQSFASASGAAYADFDRRVVAISFPDNERNDVNTLIRADATVVSASRDLAVPTFGQSEQTLLARFDDSRRAQSVALEILFKDLASPHQ